MYEAIKNFNKQFAFEPFIGNLQNFKTSDKFIVCGMGGSHLAGDLTKLFYPELDIVVYSDYGLPGLPEPILKNSLIIASSYSGNTEETISSFLEAKDKNLNLAVISISGKLLELAKKLNIPYIQMPDTHIQPRMALGFSFRAILKLINKIDELKETQELADSLKPLNFEKQGKELAHKLQGKIPIIYSSRKNFAIAYNWKIKLNETGKIPAFYNLFPELNHNEMTGFDVQNSTKNLSEKFHFIFLKDKLDNSKIIRRMEVLRKLYEDRNLNVEVIDLEGENVFLKAFSSLVLADWTAYYTATNYKVEAGQVVMVEEFKKLIL